MHIVTTYNIILTFYRPRFFVTAYTVSPNSHKSGSNVWKDFVLCFVRKQARKRTYTIVSYPENLALSGASFADHKVRCGGDFLQRTCTDTSYRLCERMYMFCAYLYLLDNRCYMLALFYTKGYGYFTFC